MTPARANEQAARIYTSGDALELQARELERMAARIECGNRGWSLEHIAEMCRRRASRLRKPAKGKR